MIWILLTSLIMKVARESYLRTKITIRKSSKKGGMIMDQTNQKGNQSLGSTRIIAQRDYMSQPQTAYYDPENDPYFKPVKKSIWQKMARYKTFYFMLIPAIVFYLLFSYWPMTGNLLAFRKFSFNSACMARVG